MISRRFSDGKGASVISPQMQAGYGIPSPTLQTRDKRVVVQAPHVDDWVNSRNASRYHQFGQVGDVKVGDIFPSRAACKEAGLHKHLDRGISGVKDLGADCIVLSGGYDDDDNGDIIIYTGAGGKERGAQGQTHDQSMEDPDNQHLVNSIAKRFPVRVIRGSQLENKYAPEQRVKGSAVYRYDGIYDVTDLWEDKTAAGYKICRFRLQRYRGQPPIPRRWA